jgi:hypothetical protein
MEMAQYMFEEFHTPAIYIESYPLLALRASGRNTGIVLHSGKHFSLKEQPFTENTANFKINMLMQY